MSGIRFAIKYSSLLESIARYHTQWSGLRPQDYRIPGHHRLSYLRKSAAWRAPSSKASVGGQTKRHFVGSAIRSSNGSPLCPGKTDRKSHHLIVDQLSHLLDFEIPISTSTGPRRLLTCLSLACSSCSTVTRPLPGACGRVVRLNVADGECRSARVKKDSLDAFPCDNRAVARAFLAISRMRSEPVFRLIALHRRFLNDYGGTTGALVLGCYE